MSSNATTRFDKALTEDQFNQVVTAILNGKYSWACVLILRFAGYNPIHYIPYRTYNRLLKDNAPVHVHAKSRQATEDYRATLEGCLSLEDLGYLETLNDQPAKISGGCKKTWLNHLSVFSSHFRLR